MVDVDRRRERLIRRAFRLEWLSVAWMAVEAFGLDSVIELALAVVLIWRLSAEVRFGLTAH